MRFLVGLSAVLVATSALAQTAPPKEANKPAVQLRPQAAMGCKLVGSVRGTKIWAGECTITGWLSAHKASEVRRDFSAPSRASQPLYCTPDSLSFSFLTLPLWSYALHRF